MRSPRAAVVVALLALAGASSSRARAQSSGSNGSNGSNGSSATSGAVSPSLAKLVPPKQLDTPPVPYPKGGTGDAVVIVGLTIDADGAVESSEVIEGVEPFASTAREAALHFRFAPATRDGVAIRAVIRAKITFSPPAPVEPPPLTSSSSSSSSSKAPPSKPPLQPIELVVEGEREEIGATATGGGEVRILPGAFGDPFRVIEALPGVTPIVSGVPYFYVRGAPPGNTGYFIDGVRVPLLFHLGAGPSIITPALIDKVDFWPGGYPARYGRFTGGIVAAETPGPPTRARGEWQVRLFDASAMLATPLDDGRSDVLVAGRYGYPGLLLSAISPDTSLQYWDYQLRAGRQLNEKDRASLFVFGAFDRLYDKKHEKTLFGVQFHRLDFRIDHALPHGNFRLAVTLGFDQTASGSDGGSSSDDLAIRSYAARIRGELDERLSDGVKLRVGGDVEVDRYTLVAGANANDARSDFPSRIDVDTGVRADLVIKASDRVEIVPGARLDLYLSDATALAAIEPRLAVRLGVTRAITWISSFAVAQQRPSFFVPIPGLQPALVHGLQQSFQVAQGVELALPSHVVATLTGFRHTILHLTDFLATCVGQSGRGSGSDVSKDFCDLNDRATGRSFGLEVLLKRDLTQRFGGWVAYTLSRTERTFRGVTRLSDFDRPHVLAVVASYDLGDHWRVGGRFTYVSGRPVTIGSSPYEEVRRLPDFYRLDWRLEKRWNTSETSWVTLVFEWFNTTLRKEATDFRCTTHSDGPPTDCRPDEIGPVTIPSIGVEGGF